LADRLDDQVLRFQAAWLRFRAALEGADGVEARRCQEITRDLAEDLRRPLFRWLAGWTAAGRAQLEGRVQEAIDGVMATREIGKGFGLRDAETTSLTQCGGILVTGVDVPGSVEGLRARLGYISYTMFVALAHLRAGDRTAAWDSMRAVAEERFEVLPQDVSWGGAMACAAAVVAELQRAEAAESLVAQLQPYADQVLVAAGMPFGAVSHFLGLLHAARGDLQRADASFAAAAETYTRLAAPVFLALTQTEWARCLRRRRQTDDVDRARALLVEALQTARTAGLPKLERDAVALLG
jgi:hypothetical protein